MKKPLFTTAIVIFFTFIVFNNSGVKAADKNNIIWIVEPQFENVNSFSEDLIAVKKNGKWGFINKEAKFVIDPQFDNFSNFQEGVAAVQKNGMYGLIKNPMAVKKQEQSFISAGLYIGDVKSVSSTEIIVGGKDIAEHVYMGDKLCLYSGDKIIILRSTFPMQTVTKCEVISGHRKDVKPGIKVYKYSGK